jgi:hypothetical protein
MTEVKHYKCDICGKEYPTQEKAQRCEDSHEKDLKISSAVYKADYCKGMPIEIRLENKERTKLAIYEIADVTEVKE